MTVFVPTFPFGGAVYETRIDIIIFFIDGDICGDVVSDVVVAASIVAAARIVVVIIATAVIVVGASAGRDRISCLFFISLRLLSQHSPHGWQSHPSSSPTSCSVVPSSSCIVIPSR